ncbi:Uncharacterised protein [Shigella flexneri]|nr:Uncharacterised protein [Shigella flexneri]
MIDVLGPEKRRRRTTQENRLFLPLNLLPP